MRPPQFGLKAPCLSDTIVIAQGFEGGQAIGVVIQPSAQLLIGHGGKPLGGNAVQSTGGQGGQAPPSGHVAVKAFERRLPVAGPQVTLGL
jgi:hypothetical protein